MSSVYLQLGACGLVKTSRVCVELSSLQARQPVTLSRPHRPPGAVRAGVPPAPQQRKVRRPARGRLVGEWSLGCSRRLAPGPLTGGRPDGPSAAGRPRTALGPAGAGQLPTVPRGAVRAGSPPASGQRLPPRPGGKPSRALPGSVSTAKSLSQKLVLSGCSLRSEMSLRRTPRSLGVRVWGAGCRSERDSGKCRGVRGAGDPAGPLPGEGPSPATARPPRGGLPRARRSPRPRHCLCRPGPHGSRLATCRRSSSRLPPPETGWFGASPCGAGSLSLSHSPPSNAWCQGQGGPAAVCRVDE